MLFRYIIPTLGNLFLTTIPYYYFAAPLLLLWRGLRAMRLLQRGMVVTKDYVKRELVFLFFCLYAIFLLVQTAVPGRLTIEDGYKPVFLMLPLVSGAEMWSAVNLVPFTFVRDAIMLFNTSNLGVSYTFVNIFGNIASFMVIGYLVVYLWRISLLKMALLGFGLSLLIELCQLPVANRATDIDDLVLNTFGALAGYALYHLICKMRRRRS